MSVADASENVSSWCEQQWLTQSAEYADRDAPDYGGLLEHWRQYAARCSGTVAYEARLAFIYFYLDQPEKAKEALKPIVNKKSEYGHLVQLAQLLIEANELMIDQKPDTARLDELEIKLLKFVRQYPQQLEGYGLLGGVETLLGHHDAAIKTLEKAALMTKSMNSKAGIYRNLTISYAQAGRYQDAYDAAGTAISLRKSVMSDQYFVYAVAKADAGLEKFSDAQTALRVLAAKKPEVKKDPDFLATVDFVFEKIKQSKEK